MPEKTRQQIRDKWSQYAKRHLEGRTIVEARLMTDEEAEECGWDRQLPVVLVLDNGTVLYPSADDEGNGPGAVFGVTAQGESLLFPVCY